MSITKKTSNYLKNKTILITGGAGSIGYSLAKKVLEYPVKSVRVLDINEYALFKLKHKVSDSRLRLLLGSITDEGRVEMACQNVDIIFHAAAIKNIEISEFNPIETIETNVNGLVNLIKVLNRTKPELFLNISTDKAVNPSTLYGTTKQLAERLCTWVGFQGHHTKYATVRLGNVFETQGNVFEIWKEQKDNDLPLSITDPNMKRFFFHMDEAISFIFECIPLTDSGEIFIPKMKLYNIKDCADKISKNHKIIGIRKGEKLDEVLISDSEKKMALERKNIWIISEHKNKKLK